MEPSRPRPRVTIGVPVFQGAALIGRALDCLSAQSFHDIRILVSDNGSTDDTVAIVERAMAADPRIELVRQPRNIGALANFGFCLEAAETEFFAWRAYDDLSDERYVERLVAALDADPGATAAVPSVETIRTEENRRRFLAAPSPDDLPADDAARERFMIRRLQASWCYGLYRTAFLRALFQELRATYPHTWAWDFLLLAGTALTGRFATAPEAVFRQFLTAQPKQYSNQARWAERVAIARDYWTTFRTLAGRRERGFADARKLDALAVWHLQRRVAKWPLALAGIAAAAFSPPASDRRPANR